MKQITAANLAKFVKTTDTVFMNHQQIEMIAKTVFNVPGLDNGLYVYKVSDLRATGYAKPFAKVTERGQAGA